MSLFGLRRHPHNQPRRVLILEDDIELSMVIERILKSIDSRIILDWATSAEFALEQLKGSASIHYSAPYDLIVADIFLDGKSTGIDFWRICNDSYPDIPIIITSALGLDRFFSTIGHEAISPPYLQKPFTSGECRQAFKYLLCDQPKRKSTSAPADFDAY